MNVFDIINNVTSRVEPFHSQFFAALLREDIVYRKKFLNMVLPDIYKQGDLSLDKLKNQVIEAEEQFDDHTRIDIIIKDDLSKLTVGIEVKTKDSSVTDGQLRGYFDNLSQKHNGFDIYIIFLTPFNEKNSIANSVSRAVLNFTSFKQHHNNSVHINWDDVVDLYDESCTNWDILSQHKQYIKNTITNPAILRKVSSDIERDRELSKFFSAETVLEFFEYIEQNSVYKQEKEKIIVLPLEQNKNKLIILQNALKILMDSKAINISTRKMPKVDPSLADKFQKGLYGPFFKSLFDVINLHPFLWLEGMGDIGIRGISNISNGGFSLFTIKEDCIELRKHR